MQLQDFKRFATERVNMGDYRHRRGGGAWGSYLGLLAALLMAVGPEMAEAHSWAELLTPAHIGDHLHVIGGAIVGWITPSPIQKGS